MDERRIVWDAANRKHLLEDHPERDISIEEIEQVLVDTGRTESYLEGRAAYQTIGQTAAGRWLVVAWIVQSGGGAYPIHARAASRRLIREADSMKLQASREPFHDPFDELTDAEFEKEILDSLEQTTTKISLRVPRRLLERTKAAASRRKVPYQSLMKALIDQGVTRLERAGGRPSKK